jgi:hypothetical protein
MRNILISTAACAVFAFAAGGAQAAVSGALTFDTPTGVVAAGDTIDVWLTLTMAADSDTLTTDEFGNVTSGLSDDDIAAAGADPENLDYSIVNIGYSCGGETFGFCSGGTPYDITFNYDPLSSFIGAKNLNLTAGSVTHWLLGTYAPAGGAAPAGTYSFFQAEFGFQFSSDPNENPKFVAFADTCPSLEASCGFSRTVEGTAVPEPATWAMMLLGFTGMGVTLRARRRRAA